MSFLLKSLNTKFQGKETTKNRIIKWKELADKEKKDLFKKFIFKWIAFNGLYNSIYEIDHRHLNSKKRPPEFKIIEYFCDEFILTNKTLASEVYSDIIRNEFDVKVKNRDDMFFYFEHLESAEKIEEKAKNLIMIAYKIRCRLFHGDKNPDLNVNKDVVKLADQVIKPVLDYYFPKKKKE